MRERVTQLNAKYYALDSRPHFKDAKAKFISCKNCGSALNRERLGTWGVCPLCHTDLRPKSTIEAIARAKAACETAEKKYEAAKKKASAYTVHWLVKVEYHT